MFIELIASLSVFSSYNHYNIYIHNIPRGKTLFLMLLLQCSRWRQEELVYFDFGVNFSANGKFLYFFFCSCILLPLECIIRQVTLYIYIRDCDRDSALQNIKCEIVIQHHSAPFNVEIMWLTHEIFLCLVHYIFFCR